MPKLDSSMDKSKLISAIRKSDRLQKDKETIRNLKAVLSVRDKLNDNSPGQVVNGRELFKPVVVSKTNA